MSPFENHPVNIDHLSPLESLRFSPLDKNYRKASLLISSAWLVVLLLLCIAGGFYLPLLMTFPYILIVVGGYMLLSGIVMIMAYASYDYMGYVIRQRDILFKSGILFRSQIIIPFSRIQHCETHQGPIDRWLGLSEIAVFTAGGSGGDLVIPGLKAEDAENLKVYITRRIADHDEEE
jgi:membrane protein YdbS with pleckstrin-like domain